MNYNHSAKHVKFFAGKFYLVLVIIANILITSCGQASAEKEIVIISTNDIHGNIDQFPRLATFVQQTREEYKHVILVDAGDRFIGNPYVDYATEQGKPIISLMNNLGYDLATLGNHEFDFGQKVLRDRINNAKFPIICANINSSRSTLDTLPPHATLNIDGLKLCFLGLIGTLAEGIPDTNPTHLKDITFSPFEEMISRYRDLNKTCDAFIGLTHLGFNVDSTLATLMPELNVIIGGHTHKLLEDTRMVNDVMICQAGGKLQYAGITHLTFQGKKLTKRSYRTVCLDSIISVDSTFQEQVNQINNQPGFNQVIGHLPSPLSSKEAIAGIVTTAMAKVSQCDFAFYNHGGIRVTSLPGKDILLTDILKAEPFANYIVVHEMTTEDIKTLIGNRFYPTGGTSSIDLFMSPGKYKITTKENGNILDVVLFDKDGKTLPNRRKWRVALNTFVNSKYNFPGKDKGVTTNITIVDAIVQFLKENKSL